MPDKKKGIIATTILTMTIFENPSDSTVVQEVSSYPDIPLCKGSEKRPLGASLKQFWLGEIDVRWTDLILLACTFCSGLVDGLAFNSWGNYVNMHTGMSHDYPDPYSIPGSETNQE